MKCKILLIVLTLFIFFDVSAYADNTNGVGEVQADKLNVRAAPGMDASITGHLSNGAKVNVITKTSKTWYRIEYLGKEGYVHADYLDVRRGDSVAVQAFVTIQSFEGLEKGQQVVEFAKQFIGVPYRWGGTSPEGFDCSGLVYYVYEQFGIRLNRVAADQNKNGVAVHLGNLAPGDLVFFHNRAYYSDINHVGIYVGDNQFIHSPQTGDFVKISTMESGYYKDKFVSARRVFE